ncbi:MAG: hypothetical protein FJW88_12175 [Actinobacteria bacterium]|nr:hypothetical protein [Actinomycetota bacterium]
MDYRGELVVIAATGSHDLRQSAADPVVHDRIEALLRVRRRRYTPRCREVIDVLASSGRPLTADEVAQAEDSLSISTVYRTTGVLADLGVLRSVAGVDGVSRFELSEALSSHHHHHLLCRQCGLVLDYELPAALEKALHAAALRITRRAGFTGPAERFDIEGLCPTCTELVANP